MSVIYGLADRRDPETGSGSGSGSDNQGMYVDKNGFQLHIEQEPTGGKIIPCENSGLLKREKCDVRFLGEEALYHHKLRGDNEGDVRKNFHCGVCRINFKDEAELKLHVMENHTVEALDLHSKEVHKPKPTTTHLCLSCDILFDSISAITQHIESGKCLRKLSASNVCNQVNSENNPPTKEDLLAGILAGTITTYAWRAGIIPPRIKATLADTPDGFKAEELVPKDLVRVLDHTLPAKPASSSVESPGEYWNEMLGAYVCPILKCRKKFSQPRALKDHLQSSTHDQKSFRCPTCFSRFASSSALLQHAESQACGVKRSPAYKQLIKDVTGGLMGQRKNTEYKTCWRN